MLVLRSNGVAANVNMGMFRPPSGRPFFARVAFGLSYALFSSSCISVSDSPNSLVPHVGRFTSVVQQKLDYSCGAAALATILTYSMKRPISEDQILVMLKQHRHLSGLNYLEENGISLRELEHIAKTLGYKAGWRKILPIHLSKIAPPLIVFTSPEGQSHFSVLVAIYENNVYLADPTLGNIKMSLQDFIAIWAPSSQKYGYALAIENMEQVIGDHAVKTGTDFNKLLPHSWFTAEEAILADHAFLVQAGITVAEITLGQSRVHHSYNTNSGTPPYLVNSLAISMRHGIADGHQLSITLPYSITHSYDTQTLPNRGVTKNAEGINLDYNKRLVREDFDIPSLIGGIHAGLFSSKKVDSLGFSISAAKKLSSGYLVANLGFTDFYINNTNEDFRPEYRISSSIGISYPATSQIALGFIVSNERSTYPGIDLTKMHHESLTGAMFSANYLISENLAIEASIYRGFGDLQETSVGLSAQYFFSN